MILRRRAAAHDARGAALDVLAAARFLAAAGIRQPILWIEETDGDADPRRRPAVDAWTHGIAVVSTTTREAKEAADATATAIGATLVDARSVAGASTGAPFDGTRLAARHAFGLYPDEVVELVVGETASSDLAARLADFDALVAADRSVPRRLLLADLPDIGPQLTSPVISAIVHPLVLIDLRRPEPALIDLARAAADEVVGPS